MKFRWNDWNLDHVPQHGVDPAEAELVVRGAQTPFPLKREDEKWLVWGRETISKEKTMRNHKKIKPALKKELDTTEFDEEFIVDTFKPLSAEDKVRWESARKKGDRKKTVTLEVEQELLDHLDGLAKKMKVSRESLVKRGIKAVLALAGENQK